MEEIVISPIAFFKCPQINPADSPRQGTLSKKSQGQFELLQSIDVEALRDLEGFSHIWLLYKFHHNQNWKSHVRPPRGGKKRGLFATRSPYRPNGIGMSCVELEKIEGRKVFVKNHDLLDGTPILDIKPYIAYADSFPMAKKGWLGDCVEYEVQWDSQMLEKLNWLQSYFSTSISELLKNQLAFEPTNNKIKRVKIKGDHFVFSFKTWRFLFRIDGDCVKLFDLKSGYSILELEDDSDPYGDKSIHRQFFSQFHGQ